MSTTSSLAAVNPDTNPHLSGVFTPTTAEVEADNLKVIGHLPVDLDGLYLRNGPNPRFTPLGSYVYPLEGDGMVHAVRIAEGRARYANRFVRTPALRHEEHVGHAIWPGLMTGYLPSVDEVGPFLANTARDTPCINVVRHGGRLLALAESDVPFRLTAQFDSVGRETFAGELPAGITAHPKIDSVTGEMVVFCYQLEAPFLTWAVIDRSGTVTRPATPVAGVDRPTMIHDMALTSRYLVLVLAPLTFDLSAAGNGGSPLRWGPRDGTRIALIPRDGGPVRWATTEAFWLWHTANAYDEEDRVVLDYVEWSRPGVEHGDTPVTGGLTRALINPATCAVTRTRVDDRPIELPRIDDRLIGRPYHLVAVAGRAQRTDLPPGAFDAVRCYDVTRGTFTQWDAGRLVVGEPVFVPHPAGTAGETGWWVTIGTDSDTMSSWFVVLPADDLEAGPVAQVRLPIRVPQGLHGIWVPTA
jgi:carotenoid cleavage dioxygenase